MHEAKCHEHNSFLTLTYADCNLPANGSLHYPDFQAFMKRARSALGPLRFYMCGEYGEKFSRPHYHVCLFGNDFQSDRKVWKRSRDNVLYRSDALDGLWRLGQCLIGNLTFESAAYVARYVMKKVGGEQAKEHYRRIDEDTGEVFHVEPEFCHMSLKPGIGASFAERFASDIYPHDYVVINGNKSKPPRYYDKRLKKRDPGAFEELKAQREHGAAVVRFEADRLEAVYRKELAHEQSPERLKVREAVSKARVSFKSRSFEK